MQNLLNENPIKSIIELVKKIHRDRGKQVIITKKEYEELIKELWHSDNYLQKKYSHYSLVPTIYKLYGVNIIIN